MTTARGAPKVFRARERAPGNRLTRETRGLDYSSLPDVSRAAEGEWWAAREWGLGEDTRFFATEG